MASGFNFGTKEVRRLLRAVDLRNSGVTFAKTGNGHLRIKADGLPPVIISQGKSDPWAHDNAMKELRKAGYKL